MAEIRLCKGNKSVWSGKIALVDAEVFAYLEIVGPWYVTERGFPYRMLGIDLQDFDGSVKKLQYNMRMARLVWALMLEPPDSRMDLVRDKGKMYLLTSIEGPYNRLVHSDDDPLNCTFENLTAKVQQRTLVLRKRKYGTDERHKAQPFEKLSDEQIMALSHAEMQAYFNKIEQMKKGAFDEKVELPLEHPAKQQVMKQADSGLDVLKKIYGTGEKQDEQGTT